MQDDNTMRSRGYFTGERDLHEGGTERGGGDRGRGRWGRSASAGIAQ